MTGPVGKVSIVGAGPGDPELITIKAVKRPSQHCLPGQVTGSRAPT
ncbi:hypothetical protein [Paenibacillus oralis]|nr:hypothetical protein [Paenibacillus oralis]